MVQDYQSKKEYLVLSMVRKYPLYSLNKLAEELPEISRHSIQRILEKNNLSTVEKRLAFTAENKGGVLTLFKGLRVRISFLKPKHFSLKELKASIKKFRQEPRLSWSMTRR